MSKAYLGLGGNVGDSRAVIEKALCMLSDGVTRVVSVSSYYRTRPVGYPDQDDFLNIACEIETGLGPLALLARCNAIEDALGRVRNIKNGPRTIDLDILLYEGVIMNTGRLTIPHPRMAERGFVIVPLYEIAPGLTVNGKAIRAIYEAVDKSGVSAPVSS